MIDGIVMLKLDAKPPHDDALWFGLHYLSTIVASWTEFTANSDSKRIEFYFILEESHV